MAIGDLDFRCDAARSALVVIDVQRDFCDSPEPSGRPPRRDEMRAMAVRLDRLIGQARTLGVPVIFVRTIHDDATNSDAWCARRGSIEEPSCRPGTPGVEFFVVQPQDDVVVTKRRYSAFVGTELEMVLRRLGRDSIVLTGVMTDVCVETTARHGMCLDFFATVVADCCEAASTERHEQALRSVSQSFGLVATAEEVLGIWERTSHLAPAGLPAR